MVTSVKRRFAVGLAGAVAAALIAAPSAPAVFERSYCGQVYTPAHGSCWYSERVGGAHSWTNNRATYGGGGSFKICAALGYYPKDTIVSRCENFNTTVVFVTYCGSPTTANKDAGVGNTDNSRHTIQGHARTGGC
jgi:hypothetical protein